MTLGTGDKHPIKDTLGTQTHVKMKTGFEVIGHSKSLSQLSKHRILTDIIQGLYGELVAIQLM